MTKTRSASTSEPSVHERRSLRLARDVEASGSTKLKRNSMNIEGFVRASPRRKVAKLSSDYETHKKETPFSPYKQYPNTPSKHFTRSSKQPVFLVRSNKSSGVHSQSITRSRRKSSSIVDSSEILLPKMENCSFQPQNTHLASLLQENGSPVFENGNALQNERKHVNNRTLRRRQSQFSSNDRPLTRLSSGREQDVNNGHSSYEGIKNPLQPKSEVVETYVDIDCTPNGCTEKEDCDKWPSHENSSTSLSVCCTTDVENVSIQEESKEKLDIEELLDIEYSDISSDDFIGFQGKRKMNLRSSGVHCDPNYYALSLELLKKSRSKSITSTSARRDDKSEDTHIENRPPPNPESVKNDNSPEVTNSCIPCETVLTQPASSNEQCGNESERKTQSNDHDGENSMTSTTNLIQVIQDNVGIACNEALTEDRNLVDDMPGEGEASITSENDATQSQKQCLSEHVSSEIKHDCSEGPVGVDKPVIEVHESPINVEICQTDKQEMTPIRQIITNKQMSPSSKRKRGNLKQRTKEAVVEKPKIQMLFRDPAEPPPLFVEEAIPRADVYYFESDHVALKHNKDYQGLLKGVALLEAQRHQCLRDIESLRLEKDAALVEPVEYVDKLQTDPVLHKSCQPQKVAALPTINWQKYSSQYGTFSNVFGNDSTSSKPVTRKLKIKYESGVPEQSLPTDKETEQNSSSQSTRVTWTVDEQLKLEELLLKYPSEPVEFNRFRKIAAALGNRTPLQVQSRVQKYFIKLARAGLPVPGIMPRSSRRTRENVRFGQSKRARTHPQQSYLRASTFFPQLHCPVQMSGDDDISLPSTSNGSASDVTWEQHSDDEDIPEILRDSEEYIEILRLKKLRKSKIHISDESVRQTLARHTGYACDMCDSDPIMGVRYHCIDCPQDTCVDLCQSCIHLHGQFVTDTHRPSHRMEPVYESQNFLDGDYMKFNSSSGEYNYLDPNFHPASI